MRTGTGAAIGCGLLTFILACYAGLCALLACWTDRNLDFWLSEFTGKAVDVNWWLSLLATLLLSPVILAANVVGEICRACV